MGVPSATAMMEMTSGEKVSLGGCPKPSSADLQEGMRRISHGDGHQPCPTGGISGAFYPGLFGSDQDFLAGSHTGQERVSQTGAGVRECVNKLQNSLLQDHRKTQTFERRSLLKRETL